MGSGDSGIDVLRRALARRICAMALLAGSACATPAAMSPAPETTGGPLPGHSQLPPGPWTVDTLTVTDSCGEGAGLLLTQLLTQRGYRVVAVGAPTRAEIRCDWRHESVHVWEVDTPRAQAECVARDVPSLSLSLKVLHKAYAQPGEAEATLASARFQGRARLDAEPPHRGCVVRKEESRSLLERALRSVGARIPAGAQTPPPLVAPAPAGADVVVGEAGPDRHEPDTKSIYPVDFGDRPAPVEAATATQTPGKSAAAQASDRRMPPEAIRDERGRNYDEGPRLRRRDSEDQLWRRFELAVGGVAAACTDFCAELFSGGVGPEIRLLFRAHDLVALEGGWRRVAMAARDRVRVPDDVETVLTDLDLGARVYVGRPGGIRAFGGLGVAKSAVGDEWQGAGQTEGARFSGFATRLLLGAEVPALPWLRVGAQARYDRVEWDEVCERAGACEEVDRFHPIVGSDILSAAVEVGLAWP